MIEAFLGLPPRHYCITLYLKRKWRPYLGLASLILAILSCGTNSRLLGTPSIVTLQIVRSCPFPEARNTYHASDKYTASVDKHRELLKITERRNPDYGPDSLQATYRPTCYLNVLPSSESDVNKSWPNWRVFFFIFVSWEEGFRQRRLKVEAQLLFYLVNKVYLHDRTISRLAR